MKSTDDYLKFLSFPSISANPEHAKDMSDCCHWLKSFLDEIGLQTELWNEEGRATIFASDLRAGEDKPTLLLYTHYDVQPADPLDLWDSPPFEPRIENGEVYARGAQDNKGQCWYVLQALKQLLEEGALPVNIKLIIDGEEEIGSFALHELLPKKKEELSADYLAIVDLGMPSKDTPAITLGTRGVASLDLEVECAKRDLHSGTHGGIVNNPIQILVELLASAKDEKGRILVPGFYDGLIPLSEKDSARISYDFDLKEYEALVGTTATGGESDYSPLERSWLRPTLEINGVTGGYSGDGIKTVIPARASAKVSCRLVPGQDPADILEKVCRFFESQSKDGVKVKATAHQGCGAAVRTSTESQVVQAFASAYEKVFDKPCAFIYEGASIPIAYELQKASEAEIVLVGLGLIDDCIHAPNEHFGLDRIEKGKEIIMDAIKNLGNASI